MLGEKIQSLRKKNGITQEQLGENIGVTRQTISNWELNETQPNTDQLKLLSKTFNISIDELLDNDIKGILETKVSNTEKLAGIIIKIIKVMGILFIIFLVINIIAFIAFILFRTTNKDVTTNDSGTIILNCSLDDDDYTIGVGSDGSFNCLNCPKEIQKELLNKYVDYADLSLTADNIIEYFEANGGDCE